MSALTGGRLRSWLPILTWLPSYRRADLPADARAGLTTAIMLIPQAMAYAMLAGLPPIHGLYAATVPLLAYAVFGSSRQLAVGPVAMDSLLVAVGVGAIATAGSPSYVASAILLAAMVGLTQLAMGLARLGFLVNFLSRPVISGFTSAAALIIGLSQLKHLLGIDLTGSSRVHEVVYEAGRRIAETSLPTLGIGVASVASLVVLKRLRPEFPRALAVVFVGTLLVWSLGLDARGVAIVGEVPRGLPRPALPVFDLAAMRALAPTALAIAFVSFLEAVSVGKAVVAKHAEPGAPRIDANRELTGLGAANLLGSLFGGYAVAGGFSRTAVNAQAGARTQVAGLITAGVVVLTLVLLTPLFYYLPKAVLAAIIMTAVFGLIDLAMIRKLWTLERTELALLILTFAGTLALGIVEGIAIGVGASVVWFAARQARPHAVVLGRMPGTTDYRDVSRCPEAVATAGVIVLRVDAQLYFGNVEFLERTIEGLLDEAPDTRAIVIDAKAINRLDSSADTALGNIDETLAARGVTLHFAGVKGPVRDMMARSGLSERLGEGRQWATVHEAVTGISGQREQPA
ncbi:putative sulfate transporter [Enhygromyxa salina]|uniref:Putative sulfate transporter n=1 Tax=Enhygromyxa salina TaxID=215803 RepID=A0A2S9Y680_9BACT|nr:solute carrier family 26 protein [Enhygromyxa salina]PRQ00608.1 putative sulfate transporter [Enhygromyxa salina]